LTVLQETSAHLSTQQRALQTHSVGSCGALGCVAWPRGRGLGGGCSSGVGGRAACAQPAAVVVCQAAFL
jgi:hypothetical protein